MELIITLTFLLHILPCTRSIQVSKIHNTSIVFRAAQLPIIINGSCHDCACAMAMSQSYFSFNCFINNQSCAMFARSDQNKSFALSHDQNTHVYFLSLYIAKDCSPPGTSSVLTWKFNGTLADESSTYIGTPKNNASISSSSITGDDSSLSISRASSQWVSIDCPLLSLWNRSWTFEAWIYVMNLNNTLDYGLIGQCDSQTTRSCLHFEIRNERLYFGFYHDDLGSSDSLSSDQWYHVAFTFDCTTRSRSIYLNGILTGTSISSGCYQGVNGDLTFGSVFRGPIYVPFDGLIDEVVFTNRSKSASEILEAATLISSLTFDNNSLVDEGPLDLVATAVGNVSHKNGKSGRGLQIGNFSHSYAYVENVIQFGLVGQPYSFSLWIKPYSSDQSTIIHVSRQRLGLGWCVRMLGLTSSGILRAFSWSNSSIGLVGPVIPINVWTHIAVTYRSSNGLRLYINGSLYTSSNSFVYDGSGAANYVFLGTPNISGSCTSNGVLDGQYVGMVDEFRIYSRQLSAAEVYTLSVP